MNQIKDLATALYYASYVGLVFGLVAGSETIMAAATIGLGLGYAAKDYLAERCDSITVMTVYAFFGVFFFGVGNLIGFLSEFGPYDAIFNKYNVKEFHFAAQVIASLGLVVPILGYEWLKRKFSGRAIPIFQIGFDVSDRGLLVFSLALLTIAWVANFGQFDLTSLGTVSGLVTLGSLVTIFTIQSRWLSANHSLPAWSRWIPFVVMVVDATYNAMFRSLRVTVLWPIVAFCLPFVLRKMITPARVLVSVVLVGLFVISFKPLGELRGKIYGTERLMVIAKQSPLGESSEVDEVEGVDPWGLMTVAARLSSYNQLSQVVRITEDEGFYGGETLAYLTYVFIPRFIWPDKPLITPGQWFASKLGKGQYVSSTQFSNAINMTIPGELYLNFSWIGVVVGLLLLSLIYFAFWEAAAFHRADRNPLGQGFACILLMQAAFNGADLSAIVNMILWYIVYCAATWGLSALVQRRRRGRFEANRHSALSAPKGLRSARADEPVPRPVGPNRIG